MAPDQTPPGDDDLVGERYRLGRKLGTGGMASVYEAYDTLLDRTVALKRLRTDAIDEHVERFRREARIGANLNHPNLVAVYDILISGEDVLIAMEHVEGQSLGELVEQGPIPRDRSVEILTDVAGALDHAHEAGIVHRDVKPANILLRNDGRAKVVDLGIAAAVEGSRLTESNQVIGTLSYMAPERLSGDGVGGPPADVYSVAMVALQMLAGELPWRGLNPSQRLARAGAQPPELESVWPDGPPAARAVLERALDPDPGVRQPSPSALVDQLATALEGAPESAGAEPTAKMERPRPVTDPAPRANPPARPEATGNPILARPAATGTGAAPSSKSDRRSPRAVALALVSIAALAVVAVLVLSSSGGGSGEEDTNAGAQGSSRKGANRNANGEQESPAPPPTTSEPDPEPEADPEPDPEGDDPTRFAAGGPEDDGLGSRLNDQGFELIDEGKFSQAVPVLQDAVEAFSSGTSSESYYFAIFNLGNALLRSGRPEQAIPYLEARLTFDNQTETVQAKLDEARAAAG